MRQMEADLGTTLDWVAVNHHHTGHPHVHVIVRGKDDLGENLVINGDYLANGIRERASELTTLELGPVTEIEQTRKLSAEIDQDRFTRIDRAMVEEADDRFLDLRQEPAEPRRQFADIAPHLTCDQLCAYWFENDSHLDHDLLDQLAAFRAQGYALHLATVQEHERAAYLWNDMGLKDRFDAIHYAADLGHAKPADGFYAAIEARTGYAPGELFFIDDKVANVQAAQARGWKAALWTGRERLADLMAGA